MKATSIQHAPEAASSDPCRQTSATAPLQKSKQKQTSADEPVDPLKVTESDPTNLETLADSDCDTSDRDVEVFAESIEGSVEYTSLVRQLVETVRERITYFRSDAGGSLSLEEARKRAFKKCQDDEEARRLCAWIKRSPVDTVSFYELAQLWDFTPQAAEEAWKLIKIEAAKEFKSGHLASRASLPTAQLREAWAVAKFLAIRESFYDEWQPRGGTEVGLIDMLVQCYLQWTYWVEQVVLRSQTPPRREALEYREWKRLQGTKIASSWATGDWLQPYVDEQIALENATQMADRWHRMYLRSLRHLRDLRRYNSVTINNAKQVNIATDQAQQSNQTAWGRLQK
jgi:hypothetical protein